SFILTKGAYDKRGEKVQAALPASLLAPSAAAAPANGRRLNRLDLARWLVSAENPLTARVTVNRFWQAVFGGGIVKTTEDFGVQGEKPSNQDLLDWLATTFVKSGWDVKALHRTIVMSATYRQSSKNTPLDAELAQRSGMQTLADLDPENRMLARGPR